MRYTLLIVMFGLMLTACNKSSETADYRIPFTGNYDAYKAMGGPIPDINFDIVVTLDPESDDKIYIDSLLVPISEQGTYGPDLLQADFFYNLQFRNDSIFIRSHIIIPNGIVAPCVVKGVKEQ